MSTPISPSIEIRPATSDDVPLVLSFIQKLADYEKLRHECVATVEGLRETLFGPESHARVFLAFHHGRPAGYALYFFSYSTFLARPGIYLEDLFVDPTVRGAGIGKALLKRLAREVVERGYGRLEWSVLDWNQPAIDFYRAFGAQPMNDWTMFRLSGDALNAFAKP